MAFVATVPTTAIFKSVSPIEQTLSKPIMSVGSSPTWRQAAISYPPAWLEDAIARIDVLVENGRTVPGFGNFCPTPEAVRTLRLELNAIGLDFLPKPILCPISGGGLMVRWSSDNRSVEITVYHDGEIVKDAIEGATTNEDISELPVSVLLSWMSGRSVFVNASMR